MPVLLGEKDGGPEASDELVKRDKIWVPSYKFSRVYLVLADSLVQGERDIIDCPGVPDLFTFSQGAYAKSRSGKEIGRVTYLGVATALWEIKVNFDSNLDQDQDQEPDQQPPKVSWDAEEELRVLEKDVITDEPVQTAAGEKIILEYPMAMPVLNISRIETYPFNPTTILAYVNQINKKEFYGAPEGTALMKRISSRDVWLDNGDGVQIHYEEVNYTVKFNLELEEGELKKDTWVAEVLHEGTLEIDGLGDVVEATDKKGNPIRVNLAINGGRLLPSQEKVYLSFNRFGKADFAPLNLGPYA